MTEEKPTPRTDPLEPEYVDEVYENQDGDPDPWADASPFRSARVQAEPEPEILEEDEGENEEEEQTPLPLKPLAAAEAKPRPAEPRRSPPSAAAPAQQHPPATFKRVFPHRTAPSAGGRANARPALTPRPQAASQQESARPAQPSLPAEKAPPGKPQPSAKERESENPPDTGSEIAATIPEWYVLEDIIRDYAPLPKGSLILGIDEAGKPLVLSLDEPSPGSMLILGDGEAANRKHLRAILASAEKLNDPDLFQIDVITPKLEGFESPSSTLRRVCLTGDSCVYDLLTEVFDEVETRLRSERQLPFQLLVFDCIDKLAAGLAEESLRFLRWILRRGPQVGIWPLATIEAARLETFDLKTFRSFGLRMYGKITEGRTAARYTEIAPQVLRALSPGSQACFKIEEHVISFSIPELA